MLGLFHQPAGRRIQNRQAPPDDSRASSGRSHDGAPHQEDPKFGPARSALYWRRPTVYLDYEAIDGKGLRRVEVENAAGDFLSHHPGIHSVFTRTQLTLGQLPPTRFAQMAARTWNREVGGELLLLPKNCCYLFGKPNELTAMHGGPWAHDTNVPLMFLDPTWIAPGSHAPTVEIVDIAPALAHLLRLRPPRRERGPRAPRDPRRPRALTEVGACGTAVCGVRGVPSLLHDSAA